MNHREMNEAIKRMREGEAIPLNTDDLCQLQEGGAIIRSAWNREVIATDDRPIWWVCWMSGRDSTTPPDFEISSAANEFKAYANPGRCRYSDGNECADNYRVPDHHADIDLWNKWWQTEGRVIGQAEQAKGGAA